MTTIDDTYVLGRSDAEARRLILQHQVYGPLTRQLFTDAGIGRGMKVLEIGSGSGEVALLCADLVGPQGRVTGIDMNEEILDFARQRVAAVGWQNVEFRQGNLETLELDDEYDAIVGRWILMYVEDPADVLRRLSSRLRPGGVLVFQESADLTTPAYTYPATPVHGEVQRWMSPPEDLVGPTVNMGHRLYQAFIDAGLDPPRLRKDTPIGGGPDWPGYTLLAESLRSLLPFVEQFGTTSAAEIDVDTLEDRLRAEVVAANAVEVLPAVIGAWSAKR
ncbi:class I SAM-dependent methyltransferase [Kribbella sp. NPDC051952]|uniref:class I SAM-dependent methyltransferase n=1 Tax=Kribbella sp. NPDC051952 TaxID=3154851 RepID=UPI00343B0165